MIELMARLEDRLRRRREERKDNTTLYSLWHLSNGNVIFYHQAIAGY